MSEPSLALPALYEPVVLDVADSALAEAVRRATAGAPEGTLVWAKAQSDPDPRLAPEWGPTPGNLHFALVLEPELPAAQALQLGLVGTLATGLAVAELVLPGTGLGYRWPGTVLLNDYPAAHLVLAAPPAPDGRPEWLVAGVSVRAARDAGDDDDMPASLSRASEGPVAPEQVLALFARYFLHWINRWAEEGFAPVRRAWTQRADPPGSRVSLALPDGPVEGTVESLREDGSLALAPADGTTVVLTPARFYGLGD